MRKTILLSFLVALYGIGIITAIVLTQYNRAESSAAPIGQLGRGHAPSIGLIHMDAPISFVSGSSSIWSPQQQGASYWLEQLEYAQTNDHIKAVIIRVNSPGGTVGASQELYEAVKRVQKAGKPVITSVADLSASGGYYATVSSDRIFANPGSLIGSIGVIIGSVEIADLMRTLGIKYQAVTSGVNKDILSPYKSMSEEQMRFLQTMVNNTYEQFLTAVADGRRRPASEIRPLADGSVFTGEQAVKNGLIDDLGSLYDVIEYVQHNYDLHHAEVASITPRRSAFKVTDLFTIFAPVQPKIELFDSKFGYTPILYMYQF